MHKFTMASSECLGLDEFFELGDSVIDVSQSSNEANLGPPSEWIMMQVLYHDRYQDKT